MSEQNDWKVAEKIAAVLEQILEPEAKVEHNVYLPTIGNIKRKRQCDVVIKRGEPPRTHLTIVEVQKRNRKPDINTFHGWVQKMKRVGAQQLICVSALGFPQSIIDEVKNHIGPTVKLMTLGEFDSLRNPQQINFSPNYILNNPTFKILSSSVLKLERGELGKKEITNNEKVFSIGNQGVLMSLDELMSNIVLPQNINTFGINGESNFEFNFTDEHNIFISIENKKLKVMNWSIKVSIKVEYKVMKSEVQQYTYTQEFHDGVLAWVAHTMMEVNGKKTPLKFIFKPDSKGFLEGYMLKDD